MQKKLVTLKRHLSIGVFVVYIDTGSPVPNIPSKSRGLADENKKFLADWKWFETTVLVLSLPIKCKINLFVHKVIKHFITPSSHYF
jgi:hypothetical protein